MSTQLITAATYQFIIEFLQCLVLVAVVVITVMVIQIAGRNRRMSLEQSGRYRGLSEVPAIVIIKIEHLVTMTEGTKEVQMLVS